VHGYGTWPRAELHHLDRLFPTLGRTEHGRVGAGRTEPTTPIRALFSARTPAVVTSAATGLSLGDRNLLAAEED
jgi:hypothetical protein